MRCQPLSNWILPFRARDMRGTSCIGRFLPPGSSVCCKMVLVGSGAIQSGPWPCLFCNERRGQRLGVCSWGFFLAVLWVAGLVQVGLVVVVVLLGAVLVGVVASWGLAMAHLRVAVLVQVVRVVVLLLAAVFVQVLTPWRVARCVHRVAVLVQVELGLVLVLPLAVLVEVGGISAFLGS